MDPTKKSGKPATKTLEPPARKPSEQVPAGEDSDVTTGNDPEQSGKTKPRKNQPIEKDKESRSDEGSGCAC